MSISLPESQREAWIIGLLIGVLAFLIVIPVNIIDPSNIGWLGMHEDTRTYFLSWDFYRNSPWSFPISENPSYGMDISGSIFMADPVPLLAIPLKLFSKYLPRIFQYHGIWLLICFGLQGVFGWKLAVLISQQFWHRVAITLLFLFQLPFLSRALGHLPLMAHFFILGALLLCLQKRDKFNFVWVLIIFGASCTNAYLLLMVLGLWFSDFLRRGTKNNDGWRKSTFEFFGIFFVALFFCWQVGYFSVGGGVSASGNPYGLYRFNLLSPIDSNGWSVLLKDLRGGPGDGEGFTYLGLGFIFLLISASLTLLRPRSETDKNLVLGNYYLSAVLVAFVLYAITNNVGIGSHNIYFPLPDALSKVTSVFRGAGRMVWPALYYILIVCCFLVCKNYGVRGSALILVVAVFLQISDTSAGWGPQKKIVAASKSSEWDLGLKDPFWKEAGKHYHAVRRLPAGNVTPDWSVFASFAGINHMKTDSVYLARVNNDELNRLDLVNQQRIEHGDFESDSLYIVSNRLVPKVLEHLKADTDMLATVDGYVVLAPKWKDVTNVSLNTLNGRNYMLPASSGATYSMVDRNSTGVRALFEGWDKEIGGGGVWSSGDVSVLKVPVEAVNFNAVKLVGTPLVAAGRPQLSLTIQVNGSDRRSYLIDGSAASINVRLNDIEKNKIQHDGMIVIRISYFGATSPKALGINSDERLISYALKSIEFE